MPRLGLNEAIDRLTMANSISWCVHVLMKSCLEKCIGVYRRSSKDESEKEENG